MFAIVTQSWADFQRHKAQWLAAALAYFAAFAVAPLVIVVTEIAGFVIHNHHQMLNMMFGYLQQTAGSSAVALKQVVAATFNQPRQGIMAEICGWIVFVVAALGLFSAMQFALNTVWDLEPRRLSLKETIAQRGSNFSVMLAVALLLLVSLGVNSALTMLAGYFSHMFAGLATLVKIGDFLVSFGVIWAAFALLYQYLPDCRIDWRDVQIGAAMTSLLFVIGEFLLGWYLGRTGIASGYGAFGSFVLFLLWLNYSAQVVLFGAEMTHVFAEHRARTSTSLHSP